MDKNILKQFLKAGFIYQRELFPTEEGTPQGGIISPILANMTAESFGFIIKMLLFKVVFYIIGAPQGVP